MPTVADEFANARAVIWWGMREELDSDQEGESSIALPPSPDFLGDFTVPTRTAKSQGILVESKDDIRKRLGRSTGKGDAVGAVRGIGG